MHTSKAQDANHTISTGPEQGLVGGAKPGGADRNAEIIVSMGRSSYLLGRLTNYLWSRLTREPKLDRDARHFR